MLLKEIKVITAFSVSCFLKGAFKQFCCIKIIAGKKRVSLASNVPHFYTENPFVLITDDYAYKLPDGKR